MLAVCGIVRRKGKILVCKRPACGMFPSLWELPTESLEENETIEDALERVFFERLTVNVKNMRAVGAVSAENIRFLGYEVELRKNFFHIYGYEGFRWVKPSGLSVMRIFEPHVTLLTHSSMLV
ncbi:MAG: NUDIX domain-containing protein [Fibrobacter sp.]|nr:NUDIX domain-containing protein [Fibrobacter sp.]